MATLTPSRITPLMQGNPDAESLQQALRPWRRRLVLQQLARWTMRGLVPGLVLASLILLLSHLLPFANARFWASGIGIFCLLVASISALWFHPSLARTARIVDRRLGLHDRLGTAWELRDEHSALAGLQRRDALKQLGEHTPTKTLSLRPGRALLLLFLLVAALCILLIALPNPMDAVLKQQAAFKAQVATQIQHIEQIRKELQQQSTLTPQQKVQANQILQQLEQQLAQAKNANQAQQALANAQAKLDQLRNPQTAQKTAAQTAAGNALQSSGNANLNAIGQALAKGDPKSLSKALQNLSSQISKLTPQQRSQLAQQLENAANQASQDSQLSSSLSQLAKSLADGTASDLSAATSAVQSTAQQNATAQAQDNSITQTEQGVQQSANNLAGNANSNNGQQGQGKGQNQGQSQSQQGQGQSQQGQGQGQNQNQGQGQQGQGQGQGQSQQGQGQNQGQGGAGGRNGAGNQQGSGEQVYVPGQIGNGNSTQSNSGQNGVVQQGSDQPYSQLIAQYSQMAHDAIDNSNIPPNMKDLIQSYFNSLEGQGQ